MKRVIVTGAASGLGRAIALRYVREEADICIRPQSWMPIKWQILLTNQCKGIN